MYTIFAVLLKKTGRMGLLSMLVILMLPFIISYADAYGKIMVDEGTDWGMKDDFGNCNILLQVKVDDGVRKQTIGVEPNAFGKDNPTTTAQMQVLKWRR